MLLGYILVIIMLKRFLLSFNDRDSVNVSKPIVYVLVSKRPMLFVGVMFETKSF